MPPSEHLLWSVAGAHWWAVLAETIATVFAETLVLVPGLVVPGLVVHASQSRRLGVTVHQVNRLLRQHGGDLVPHRVRHLFLFGTSVEFLDQIFDNADLVLVERSLRRL